MYNVTKEFRGKIQELTREFTLSIDIIHNGGRLTITDEDITNGSFTLNEATQSSGDFSVGGIFGNNIGFNLINDDKYKDIDFMNARVIPTVGLVLAKNSIEKTNWDELTTSNWRLIRDKLWEDFSKESDDGKERIEYVPLGQFNIDFVNEHRTTTEIRAIDDMIKLDKSYDISNITYPTTLKQIFINLCNVGEVRYATTSFLNENYVVQSRPVGKYSLRDILSFVAEASGNYAQFNRLGSLELKWYDDESVTITPDHRSEFVAKKFKVKVTGVSKTVRYSGGEDEVVPVEEQKDTVYLAGEKGYIIDLSENPLLQKDFEPILQSVYMKIKDTIFNPYEAKWQGNPAIQAGDKVTHVSVGKELENGIISDGEIYNTIITHSTYSYRGAGTLSAQGIPEIAREFTGLNINRIIREIEVDINREVSRLDQERLKATELIANMLGGHFIQKEDSVYIASGPDIYDENTRVWKWGIGGFGYFPNGLNGEVLTGITAEGTIIAELVAAGIVSADYIETGRLSSHGGETWIDLGTGHFQLGGVTYGPDGFNIRIGNQKVEDFIDGKVDGAMDYTDGKFSSLSVDLNGISGRVISLDTKVDDNIKVTNTRIGSLELTDSKFETRISTAQSTADGANSTANDAYSIATQTATEIVNKVGKGDLGSEFYQSAGKIRLNAKNIDLVGAVSVLSDIAGNLGSITAGTINIGSNAFRVTSDGWLHAGNGGFSVPPNSDGILNDFGGAARWKYNNSNYIFQNWNEARVYINGVSNHTFMMDGIHTCIRLGDSKVSGSIIKSLGSSDRAVQIRDGYDSVYIPVAASDFRVGSSQTFKTDIQPCIEPRLGMIKETGVVTFKFNEDKSEKINTGFISENAPKEITAELGDGFKAISLMDTVGTLWKAVQELNTQVEVLTDKIVEMETRDKQ